MLSKYIKENVMDFFSHFINVPYTAAKVEDTERRTDY